MSQVTIEKKTAPAQTVIVHTVQSSLKTLFEDIGTVPEAIMQDIAEQGLEITGPSIFEYVGCTEEMEDFTLHMCFPIPEGSEYNGSFTQVTIDAFPCLETRYIGNMTDLGPIGWMQFMNAVQESQEPVSDVMREVYTEWKGPESSENIVELQVGIK